MGSDLKTQGLSVNPDLLLKGMKDALEGNEPLMTMEEAKAAMMELQ